MKKIILAFSGGIGTTACVDLLRRRYQAEVITFTANIGQRASAEALSDHALDLGATRALIGDLRERFVTKFVWPVLRAGAIYDSGYALSSALARPLIVAEIVRIARELGATHIAHGCAAKSNDQVRFETSTAALAPDIQVLSPLREAGLLHYAEILDYVERQHLPFKSMGGCFSITENLWGTTFQWERVPDPWDAVPESHYRLTRDPETAKDTPEEITIGFERCVPKTLNGEALGPVEILTRIAAIAGEHGVGRLDTFEDRLIGIKTRDVYEQPAATVLHTARQGLESLVLSRDVLRLKPQMSRRYAHLIYDGFWYSDLRRAFDGFFERVAETASGDVRLRLFKGLVRVTGVRSSQSLYSRSSASTSPEDDEFEHANVPGLMATMSAPIKAQTEMQHPFWPEEFL